MVAGVQMNETLHKTLNLRCSHHTKHAWTRNTTKDTYPAKLCRRTTSHADGKVDSGTANSAESDGVSQVLTSKTETSVERDEEFLSTSSASERRKLELSVQKLHHDCGHPPDITFWCECYVGEVPKITCWHQPDSFVAVLATKRNHLVRNLCRQPTRIAIEIHRSSTAATRPDPSFLEHLQGMDAARETQNCCREHHAREIDEVDFWRRGEGTRCATSH